MMGGWKAWGVASPRRSSRCPSRRAGPGRGRRPPPPTSPGAESKSCSLPRSDPGLRGPGAPTPLGLVLASGPPPCHSPRQAGAAPPHAPSHSPLRPRGNLHTHTPTYGTHPDKHSPPPTRQPRHMRTNSSGLKAGCASRCQGDLTLTFFEVDHTRNPERGPVGGADRTSPPYSPPSMAPSPASFWSRTLGWLWQRGAPSCGPARRCSSSRPPAPAPPGRALRPRPCSLAPAGLRPCGRLSSSLRKFAPSIF